MSIKYTYEKFKKELNEDFYEKIEEKLQELANETGKTVSEIKKKITLRINPSVKLTHQKIIDLTKEAVAFHIYDLLQDPIKDIEKLHAKFKEIVNLVDLEEIKKIVHAQHDHCRYQIDLCYKSIKETDRYTRECIHNFEDQLSKGLNNGN